MDNESAVRAGPHLGLLPRRVAQAEQAAGGRLGVQLRARLHAVVRAAAVRAVARLRAHLPPPAPAHLHSPDFLRAMGARHQLHGQCGEGHDNKEEVGQLQVAEEKN